MKFFLPVVLLSSYSAVSQGTPAPCPYESTPAITPQPTTAQPTTAPCPVVEEQAPAPTEAPVPTPEPTVIPCDEQESEPVTEAPVPTPEPTAIPCDPQQESEPVTEAPVPTPEATAIPCDPQQESEPVTEAPVVETPAPTPESTIVEEEYILECDEEEQDEETTAYCGYQPVNAPEECDGTNGWYPISVEGVEGIFCVQEALCVADQANGHCPGPRAGLPHGSICGIVRTGVYGCIPAPYGTYGCGSSDPEATPTPAEPAYPSHVDEQHQEEEPVTPLECENDEDVPAECDGTDGWYPISVEGVEEIFCVKEQLCVAEIMGNCPGPRAGLPHGSVCDRVRTGVLGCVPAAFGTYKCGSSDPEAVPAYSTSPQEDESTPQSAYSAAALSAAGSSIPAAAVGAIVCAAIAVVSALFIAGYRRHQRRQAENDAVISTPVGDANL